MRDVTLPTGTATVRESADLTEGQNRAILKGQALTLSTIGVLRVGVTDGDDVPVANYARLDETGWSNLNAFNDALMSQLVVSWSYQIALSDASTLPKADYEALSTILLDEWTQADTDESVDDQIDPKADTGA